MTAPVVETIGTSVVTTVLMSALGVGPLLICSSLAGAYIGTMFAAPAPRWKALATYMSSSYLASVFGLWAGEHWGMSDYGIGGAAACMGIFLHVVVEEVAKRLPSAVRASMPGKELP